jgi:hypothetical protein
MPPVPVPDNAQDYASVAEEKLRTAARLAQGDDIDQLNAKVLRAVYKDNCANVEDAAAAAVKRGDQVYHHRGISIVIGFAVAAAYILTFQAPSVPFALGALAIMWFTTDFYGAVLHVVLDHAPFIDAPIISTVIGACTHEWD